MSGGEDPWEWVGLFETLGGTFDLLDPDPADISISDIANALSNICRYNGHVPHFYSVADHSVRVMHLVAERSPEEPSRPLLMAALLHDAAEAYIGDVIRPLKRYLDFIQETDEKITKIIFEKYGALYPIPKIVEEADRDVYYWEREHIRNGNVVGLEPRHAREQFIGAFNCVFAEPAKE
jgi:hypothetical protein